MTPCSRRLIIKGCIGVLLAGLLPAPSSLAQPSRIIRMVVPFPAGGTADVIARVLGERIGKTQGHKIVVENRPGGGASIAYDSVARATPDGNTLVINANSFVINPHLRTVNYDPLKSFEPVCYLVRSPQVFVVNAKSPFRTLTEYVSAVRSRPAQFVFATVGPATTQHIGYEQFRRLADFNITYVPYPGGAPAVTALLGGHVSAVLANYSEVVEQLRSGTLRALATASAERIPPLPEVPTVAELGYKGYHVEVWFGAMVPAKTPREKTAELAAWFRDAIRAPEVTPRLQQIGLYPVGTCLEEFGAHIRSQFEDYGRVIREAHITD